MRTLGRFVRLAGIALAALIVSLSFAGTSFAADPLIVGYAPYSPNMPILTIDFANGLITASFVPQYGSYDGRGLEVVGNTVSYTSYDSPGDIHLAPYNNGSGGPDFATFPNPRPGYGVQDVAYSNGVLYVLAGYWSGLPIVYALSPTDGHVLSSVAIQDHPGGAADGFTVLPNGDFLINDNDAVGLYRSYSPITGLPDGLVINLGYLCSGVHYNPGDNSLYYFCYHPIYGLVRTDLNGNVLGSVSINDIFEDITVLQVPDVSGYIYLKGAPLAGRGVSLTQTGAPGPQLTTTDNTGYYQFLQIIPGETFNVFISGPATAKDASAGTVKGTVAINDQVPDVSGYIYLMGTPLAGRGVSLTQTGAPGPQLTTTDNNGYYQFLHIVPAEPFNVFIYGPATPEDASGSTANGELSP